MQVSHAIRERRSVRAFLPDPVPAETVRQIVDLAKWSPSWGNSQAWNVYIVAGEDLERLKEAYTVLGAEQAEAQTDLPMPAREWPPYLAERMNVRRPSAEVLGTGSARADGPTIWNFWGAPCLLLFAIDPQLEPAYACLDTGLFVQTFCLAAEDRGYATCIMAMAVRYADVLHEVVPQAEGKHFVIGVALGLADHTAVVNRGERNRVDTDEIATLLDAE